MSNATHTPANLPPTVYTAEEVRPFLYPDTPNARRELEEVLGLVARFLPAFRTVRRETPAPGDNGSPEYNGARETLAEVRLALGSHACNVGPRALRAVSGFLRSRSNPDADDARAESVLREELDAFAQSADLESGSGYRVKGNPNPDGLDVDDIERHGTHYQYSPEPAVNVKVHADFRRVDFADVCADLGLGRETLAPTGRYVDEDGDVCDEDDEGATPEVLPFGREWIESRWDLDDGGKRSEGFYMGPHAFATESAWEDGIERAKDLLGDFGRPELVSAGRSGGWACVKGLLDYVDLAGEVSEDAPKLAELDALRKREAGDDAPDLDDDERERLEELEEDEDDARERARELERFLGAWSEWEAYCAATVADFPRAVAWHCGANAFESEAAEYAAELERVAKVRALVAEHVPALAGLRILEDADPEELETMLARARAADEERGSWESVELGWRHTVTGEVRRSPYDPATRVETPAQDAQTPEEDEDTLAPFLRDGAIHAFGLNVLEELRTRGFHRAPELDADGYEVRSALDDGLARDGFRRVRDLAHGAGLLDETWNA